jgi:hypothetical protein
VELELQLVNTRDCDLTRAASDMLALIEKEPHAGDIKPEITESMIEVSTGVHSRHDALLAELRQIRTTVVAAADRLNVRVAGGGAHPFQHWSDRRIFDRPRFQNISQLYGYLAKQFTVFGSTSTSAARTETTRCTCCTRCRATCRSSSRCRRLRRTTRASTRRSTRRAERGVRVPALRARAVRAQVERIHHRTWSA